MYFDILDLSINCSYISNFSVRSKLGGFDKNFVATIATKVVKVPSKVAPQAFAALMTDFSANSVS